MILDSFQELFILPLAIFMFLSALFSSPITSFTTLKYCSIDMCDIVLVGQECRGNESAVGFKFLISHSCLARFCMLLLCFSL